MKQPAQGKEGVRIRWMIPAVSAGIIILVGLVAFYVRKPKIAVSDIPAQTNVVKNAKLIALPAPVYKSSTSVESALKSRRSRRAFIDSAISLKSVSQLLWSAQGVTVEWGGRTAPSAKSTYPLKIYLVANKVDGLSSGIYEYVPGEREPVHGLLPIKEGEFGEAIFTNLNQNSFKNVPGTIVIAGDMAKMASAYGGIAHDKEVYLEAGHVAQNLALQAETLKLGMVANSSFNDSIIRNIISTPEEETLIYLIPFGTAKD